MSELTADERDLLAPIDGAPMLAGTLEWAAINSGTANLEGLSEMAHHLAEAFAGNQSFSQQTARVGRGRV